MTGLRPVANVDRFQFSGTNPTDYLPGANAQALGDLFGCVGLFEHEIKQPTAVTKWGRRGPSLGVFG